MKKLLLILSVLAGSASGQTFTNVRMVPMFGGVQLYYTTTVAGPVKAEWGTTTSLGTYSTRTARSSINAVSANGTGVVTTTAGSDNSLYTGYTVLITGSSVPALNGNWSITRTGSTTFQLAGFPTTVTCASSCGVVWGPTVHFVLGPLDPSTSYYVKLSVPTGTDWDCNVSAATGTNVGCDAGTGYGTVTTLAAPAGLGTLSSVQRPDVSALLTGPPTTTLSPITLTTSVWSDFTTALTDCATAVNGTPNSVKEIKLPAGNVYVGPTDGADIPTINSGSWCIVSIDDQTKITPADIKITPAFKTQMPVIEAPISWQGQVDYYGSAGIKFAAGVRGWYFRGIKFRQQRSWLYTPTEFDVSGFDGTTNTITTTQAFTDATFKAHKFIQVYNVTGTGWKESPNGTFQISATSTGAHTITLAGITRGAGTYSGSGGKVRIPVATEVCGVTNTTPPIVTTCRNHGFSERTKVPIISITGGVVLTAGHAFPNEQTRAKIEGSSDPSWNARWTVNSTGGGNTTMTIASPGADCAASCGTIQLLQPIGIKYVGGTTSVNGSVYYEVIDDTHLSITDAVGNGAWTSGGIVAQEAPYSLTTVAMDKDASDIYFDRCFWEGGWPSRVGHTVDFECSNCGILNSYFEDQQFYRLIRPDIQTRTALYVSTGHGVYDIATQSAIDSAHGANKVFRNTTMESHGITFYMQDSTDTSRYPTNYLFDRVEFTVNKAEKAAGNTGSDGFYYGHRHHLEWKRGYRTELKGVKFVGGWADYNNCGPVMMITPTLAAGYITDIYTHDTSFEDVGEAFYMIPLSVNSFHTTPTATQNIRFENMLFKNLNYVASNPHDNPTNPPGFQCVRPFRTDSGYPSNVQIEHITAEMPRNGLKTRWITVETGGSSGGLGGGGWTVRNNLAYIYGNDSNYNAHPLIIGSSSFNGGTVYCKLCSPDPGLAATSLLAFQQAMGNLSTFSHNSFIPGRRSGTNTSTITGSNATSNSTWGFNDCILQAAPYANQWFNGFKGMHCVGNSAGGDSEDDRKAAAKYIDATNGNFRLRHDSPLLASKNRSLTNFTVNGTGNMTLGGGGHELQAGYTVAITNAPTSALNGTWTIASVTSTTAQLTGNPTTVTCSPCTGVALNSADLRPTSDGKDPGVDMDQLDRVQGKIRNARSLVTGTTTATIAYTAPDTQACYVDYSISPTFATWTRTSSDGGGVPYRTVNLTGLTTGTTYYWRVLGAVEQPTGSFTTR